MLSPGKRYGSSAAIQFIERKIPGGFLLRLIVAITARRNHLIVENYYALKTNE